MPGLRRGLSLTLAGAAFAAAWLAAPSEARAVEHQFHLGGSFGYTGLVGDVGASGLGGRVHFDYGLTDAFNLMSRVEITAYPSSSVLLPSVAVGAGYVVDILQVVPYVGGMVGVADIWSLDSTCGLVDPSTGVVGPACHTPKLALEVPFGLDYLVTRKLAVGVEGRYQVLLANGAPINVIGGFLRAEYIWGF
jgi:hypothetical protein